MVNVDMSSMPLKVIKREACLWTEGPFGLSKDLKPKGHPNTLWREKSKEIKDSMKMKDGGVHCKIYNEHCMKQRVRIPKAIWTSPILGRKFTCQTSFCRVFFMKDDVKVTVPNGTLKILIPLDGVVNWDGVLKFGGRLKGDHATHFLKVGWKDLLHKMFINRWYNWKGTYDVSVIYNGWK